MNNCPDSCQRIGVMVVKDKMIMGKKIVYIAHPIGGDVDNNVKKVLAIIRELNLSGLPIVPFAPYIVDVLALDDSDPEQRKRGFENNKQLFQLIDEVWLYGDRISIGMNEEIGWAIQLGINVVSKSEGTRS